MARSRKKTPKGGVTAAKTDKPAKRKINRKERKRVKQIMATEPDREVLPHRREVSDVWSMPKEGKSRFDLRPRPKEMRK